MNRALLSSSAVALLAALALPGDASAKATRVKIALMPIQPSKGVTPELAMVVTDSLAVELQNRPGLSVVTPKDIEAALGFERQKAKVNAEIANRTGEEVCTDNSCLAEIGGALGVDRMVSGTLTLVGQTYFLTMQSFDPRKASVVGRVQQKVKSDREDELVDAARPIVDKLFGAEPGTAAIAKPAAPVPQKPPEAPKRVEAPPAPKPRPAAPKGPPPRNSKLTVKMLEEGETSSVKVQAGDLVENCKSLTHEKPCEFTLPKGYAKIWVEGDVTVPSYSEVYLANTYHQVAEVTEDSLVLAAVAAGATTAIGLGLLGGAFYKCNSPLSGIDRELNGENARACFAVAVSGASAAGIGALLGLQVGITALAADLGRLHVQTEKVSRAHSPQELDLTIPQVAIDYSPRDERKQVLATWQF